jgi:hypothetical protein
MKTRLLVLALALSACKGSTKPPPPPPVADATPYADLELPEVGTAKLQPLSDGPMLRLTPTAIELDGVPVALPALAAAATELAKRRPTPLLVAVAPATPSATLIDAIDAVATAYPTVAIRGRSDGRVGCVPIMPATAPGADEPPFAVLTLIATALILGERPIERGELGADLDDLRRHDVAGLAIVVDGALTAAEIVPVLVVARESFARLRLSKTAP